jgi:hypothetical protein
LSFFDEDDEPRRSPRPRRARPAGGVAAADSQTLLIRRLIAGGVIVVFLILIAIVFSNCQSSRHKTALEDYNRNVTALAGDSADLGKQFFDLLGQGNGDATDLPSAISSFKVQADQQRKQAQRLDVPDEMKTAQENLLIALEMRRDGLEYIAARIRNALGDSGPQVDKAINEIAGQMQVLLASDVIWETRVTPSIKAVLDEKEIGGQRIVSSRFVPSLSWLNPQTIATQLDQQLTSGGGTSGQPTGPGLHGTGLQSTTYGDTTLQPGTTVNRLTYTPGQEFVVKFTNQGDNDEFQIKVTLRIKAGAEQTTLTTTVPKVAKGATAEAHLKLTKTPPLDSAATISVQVAAVPGEKKTDNNKSTYAVLFTRG